MHVINPIFNNNAVVIFMAANEEYVMPTAVAIQSIISNADPKKQYDIVVGNGGSLSSQKKLQGLSTNNISVRTVYISDLLDNFNFDIFNKRYSMDTYSRLFIPELFKKYSKILWLDGDVIVLRDVSELFDIDIGDNYFGAARDICVITSSDFLDASKRLDWGNASNYFQAGVMIWNIRKCVKDNMMTRFIEAATGLKKFVFQDQDILNYIVRNGGIFHIPDNWNVQTCMPTSDPYIIHYSMATKPWNVLKYEYKRFLFKYMSYRMIYECYPDLFERDDMYHYFWDFAKQSPFFNDLRKNRIKKTLKRWMMG